MKTIQDLNDPRLVKALAHPLRVSIMQELRERVASPSELADTLDVPLPNLSYHVRMLVQLDLLKLVRTRPRRGAIEHYYQANGDVFITDHVQTEIPDLIKEGVSAQRARRDLLCGLVALIELAQDRGIVEAGQQAPAQELFQAVLPPKFGSSSRDQQAVDAWRARLDDIGQRYGA